MEQDVGAEGDGDIIPELAWANWIVRGGGDDNDRRAPSGSSRRPFPPG